MTEDFRVGTSGFSFPDWVGTVYPRGIRKEDMLPWYENELGLSTVELNYTYYSLPAERTMESFARKTSGGFLFWVKLHKSFTHEPASWESASPWEGDMARFLSALRPLREAGKLAGILAQFPWGFSPSPHTRLHLARLRERVSDPLVVEFRRAEWADGAGSDELDRMGLGCCVVDEPRLRGLMPYRPRACAGLGYFRLHGRNPNWFQAPMEVRYDYLYSPGELASFVPDVKKVALSAKATFVFFNNCHAGSAARNAVEMARLLKED